MASAFNHTNEDVDRLQLSFTELLATANAEKDRLLVASTPADRKTLCVGVLGHLDTLMGYLSQMQNEYPSGVWHFDDLNDPLLWLPGIQMLPLTSVVAALNIRVRELAARLSAVNCPVGAALDSEEDFDANDEEEDKKESQEKEEAPEPSPVVALPTIVIQKRDVPPPVVTAPAVPKTEVVPFPAPVRAFRALFVSVSG
jgi:hypothetical protein